MPMWKGDLSLFWINLFSGDALPGGGPTFVVGTCKNAIFGTALAFWACQFGHSGGEGRLGEKKYIIGVSYTVGKVWASPFGIS